MSNITEKLIESNKKYGDIAAIKYYGNIISYNQLEEYIYKYVKSFKNLGVKAGDVVTICLPTIPDSSMIFYALNYIGAIANFINPLNIKEHYREYIDNINSKILIISEDYYAFSGDEIAKTGVDRIILTSVGYYAKNKEDLPNSIVMNKTGKKVDFYTMDDFFAESNNLCSLEAHDFKDDEVMGYFYTGGTTGTPKRVATSNGTVLEMVKIYEKKSSLLREGGDRNYIVIPPSHFTGAIQTQVIPHFFGSTNIPEPVYNPQDVMKKLVTEKINSTTLTATFWTWLVLNSSLSENDLANLHKPCTGGENVSTGNRRKIDGFLGKYGAGKLINGYGSTESGGPLLIDGTPLTSVTIDILDSDGNVIEEENVIGDVGFKTPTQMLGYFKDGNLIMDKKNGYFLIGDRGRFSYNEEGERLFTVVGREKEVFVSPVSGKTTYLTEFTELGESFDDIFQCHAIKKKINGVDQAVIFITVSEENMSNSEEIIRKLDEKFKDNGLFVYGYKVRDSLTAINPVTAKSDMSTLINDENDFLVVDDDAVGRIDKLTDNTYTRNGKVRVRKIEK